MAKNRLDPKTGKPLPKGVTHRSGSYRASVMIRGDRRESTHDTPQEARDWIEDQKSLSRSGTLANTSGLKKITVGNLVKRYRDECMVDRVKDRTGHIPAILDSRVASLKLSVLQPRDVRLWRDAMLKDGLAPATVVKRLNLLASIFNYAIGEWDIHITNYASAQLCKRPAGADKKRNRRLTEEEYERILEGSRTSLHADDYWLIRWSVEQGTRLSEALSLTWDDVNFEDDCFYLERVKNDAHREELGPEERPLTYGAKCVLEEKLETYSTRPAPTEHIFNCGTSDAFSVRFGRLTDRLEIGWVDGEKKDRLTFHDLRHEATSRLAKVLKDNDGDSLDLMRITGHRDVKSLNRYYQPLSKNLAEKTKKKEE